MNQEPFFTPMPAFCDSRGHSFFSIFSDMKSGQINLGVLQPDAIKAFHYHKLQWDHWFVTKGTVHTICFDVNDPSVIKHFYFGEHAPGVLSIPSGWAHGYRSLYGKESHLLYFVTEQYNSKQPDEFRIPWNVLGEQVWKTENK